MSEDREPRVDPERWPPARELEYLLVRARDPDRPPAARLGCIRGIPDVARSALYERVRALIAIADPNAVEPQPEWIRNDARAVLIRRIATHPAVHQNESGDAIVAFFAQHGWYLQMTNRDRSRLTEFLERYWGYRAGVPAASLALQRCATAMVHLEMLNILAAANAIGVIPLLFERLAHWTPIADRVVPAILEWEGWTQLPIQADRVRVHMEIAPHVREVEGARFALGRDVMTIVQLCGVHVGKSEPDRDRATATALLQLTALVSCAL